MEKVTEELILSFATEIRLIELKYNFYLGGDRAGNIKVFDKDGNMLKVLPNIQITTSGETDVSSI